MPMIMITCPNTKQPVPTGIGADEESFRTMTLDNNFVQCSACGQLHTWSKKDAFLALS